MMSESKAGKACLAEAKKEMEKREKERADSVAAQKYAVEKRLSTVSFRN